MPAKKLRRAPVVDGALRVSASVGLGGSGVFFSRRTVDDNGSGVRGVAAFSRLADHLGNGSDSREGPPNDGTQVLATTSVVG